MYSYDRTADLAQDTEDDIVAIVEAVDLVEDGQDALKALVTRKLPKLLALVRRAPGVADHDRQTLMKVIEDFRGNAVRAHDAMNGLGDKYDLLHRTLAQTESREPEVSYLRASLGARKAR